ncbi:MAG: KEOPS complex N(6)-L-threonylcarbamoyladenine synthase Kae1 [Candidatus Methanomethylicia archaeon]|nr:KEOPS complex N(6)-L-threonylcarbamoyladenine synthase Kae1 [Candidatus Methanomethylicia archaeon]MCX8169057.1 KEOPS complex N(6)-L-threonylcarbamoyladenine synthase Kae1 [Candidatus Methanomethylicia archaeon]MDW7988789.1 KEOPS complex N(6)-L-threonylcarbamoyladenine synthase Kae1 [Nitrososphaerota archaeon]
MLVLGIECTAHTFGCGIASSNGRILSNVNLEYIPMTGGIHPREAAHHHLSTASSVLFNAIKNAGVNIREIDGFAVSLGPGLGPCLRVGATITRALSLYYNKPLIPVNHCVAHIEIARLMCNIEDPLIVYISGGNTIISAFSDGRYRVFGETLDIALGNCLDVFARHAGLPHPGGPHVERLALKGSNYIELPYVVKGQDLSFSGLLTAALKKLNEGVPLEDLCFSLQETAFSMVCEVTERALVHTNKNAILLTGGVAANRRLREMLKSIADIHGVLFTSVPSEYARDNGAMIAWTGILSLIHKVTVDVNKSFILPRWRLDAVNIPWREK